MKRFFAGTIPGVIFTLLCLLIGCYSDVTTEGEPKGALHQGRKYRNLIQVLNTSEPLYLFYTCINTGLRDCPGNNCFNKTYTCEHMRQTDLTNTTYNFTESWLNETIWLNSSHSAKILQTPWPPTTMEYNITTDKYKNRYTVDMNLTYNEPDSYNCSVFDVTYPPDITADSPTRATRMYVRGPIPNGTLPPVYCQIVFFQSCYNNTIFQPYDSNCSVSSNLTSEHEEERQQRMKPEEE
uniref:Putative secreted peptide n=1 Tax=Rhipicephalus pulchellus TaxID=72859 RepID=L7M985_RHIPC